MSYEKNEDRLRRLYDDASTPESSEGSHDPYSDEDGEYGSDRDYRPNIDELSSSDAYDEIEAGSGGESSSDVLSEDHEEIRQLPKEPPRTLSSLKVSLPLLPFSKSSKLPENHQTHIVYETNIVHMVIEPENICQNTSSVGPSPENSSQNPDGQVDLATVPKKQSENVPGRSDVDTSSANQLENVANVGPSPENQSENPDGRVDLALIPEMQSENVPGPSVVGVSTGNQPEKVFSVSSTPENQSEIVPGRSDVDISSANQLGNVSSVGPSHENQSERLQIVSVPSDIVPADIDSDDVVIRVAPSSEIQIEADNIQNDGPENIATLPEDDQWTSTVEPIPDFGFDVTSSGIRVGMDADATPLDIVKLVFSEELLEFVISRTNDYGQRLVNSNRPHTRNSRKRSFRPVTRDEMLAFLGLCLLQGQVRPPKRRSMFSYSDPLYYHPFYTYVMSGRRYEQILRCINCAAESNAKGDKKVTDFIEALCENFRRIYGPDQELSIDESLILFRGRLSFRQYIKSKKARYGIKLYELTSADGYVLNILMYAGKDDSDSKDGTKKTAKIVMKLLRGYLMKGHHVYMDNFYNDVELSQKLLDLRTHTNGTLRKDRKSNPKGLMAKKLKKGEYFWSRKKQVYVSVWRDKRPVYAITTRNHPKVINVLNRYGKLSQKPEEVAEYNKFMGGIDRKDQMVSYYSSPQKTIRWYKKVFFHLLDVVVWNSFYLYKKYYKRNRKYEFIDFRDALIKQMTNVSNDLKGRDMVRTGSIYSSRRSASTATVSTGSLAQNSSLPSVHWPEEIPVPENAKRNIKYLNCCMCTKNKKRKETRYRCKGCFKKTPLCPQCFQEWHENYA